MYCKYSFYLTTLFPVKKTSINAHYTQDHDRLDDLLHQFQVLKTSDPAKSRELFGNFKDGLEQHILWEEEILFPSFELKTGISSGPTQVMRMEHRQIRAHLDAIAEKLERGDFDTAEGEVGLLSVLGPHNEKEESILYPMIDHVTDAEERAGIFARMGMAV